MESLYEEAYSQSLCQITSSSDEAPLMWNQQTMDALASWLGPFTWDSGHPLDQGRFMSFVLAAWDEHNGIWDESLAREIMEREAAKLHSDIDPDARNEYIQKKRYEATALLDFLSHVKESTGRVL